MVTFSLPTIPNSLVENDENQLEGNFQLQIFRKTSFIHNALFDFSLLKYDENYQNEVAHSDFFKSHLRSVYSKIKFHFPNGGKLVEVGCGKGAFLEIVKLDKHFDYEGFDSAYEGNDDFIHSRYLTENDRIEADVVVLRHTLEHIYHPHKFLRLLKAVFGGDAKIFIEVPQFEWIEKNKVFFDFSYEHVNYFNTNALKSLFSDVIDFGDFFGGQYQFVFASLGDISNENWLGLEDNSEWHDYDISPFISQFKKNCEKLMLAKGIWIWGGASKGVLFLYHLHKFMPSLFLKIKGVVDINPKKQNLFTPITKVKVISNMNLFELAEDGDVILVMKPNYYDEIKSDCSSKSKIKFNILKI